MENRTRTTSALFVVIMMVCLFALWGCPKKAEVSSMPEAPNGSSTAAAAQPEAKPEAMPETKPEMATAPAGEAKMPAETEAVNNERAAAAAGGLMPVYFDFDRSIVRDDARSVLQANADWLKTHPKAKIKIEGNCDERGTIEYNQALGQRRATAAKKYLIDLGIASARISLISYGKEKPVCTESNEACWQKNRRDDFVAAE